MNPPNGWAQYLHDQLLMDAYEIPVIILSAVAVYLGLLIAVRLFGVRVLTATTTADAVVIIMLGAVAGRSILGFTPTIASGAVAVITPLLMEATFRGIRKVRRLHEIIRTRPVLVFVDGKPISKACERTHTSIDDLKSAMRRAGVGAPEEVRCIILEPRGSYSVIRRGASLDRDLFTDVDGAELLEVDLGNA